MAGHFRHDSPVLGLLRPGYSGETTRSTMDDAGGQKTPDLRFRMELDGLLPRSDGESASETRFRARILVYGFFDPAGSQTSCSCTSATASRLGLWPVMSCTVAASEMQESPAIPLLKDTTEIRNSTLGPEAAARGATALIFERVFGEPLLLFGE